MKVEINSGTINQVVTAEVIEGDVLNNVKTMDGKKQEKLIEDLIHTIKQQIEALEKNPKELSSAEILKIAGIIKNEIASANVSSSGKSNEKKVINTIKTVNDYMGNTSGILLNLVKLAQLFGLH